MTPVAILILSVSMSADAFAAAVGRGAAHRPTVPAALKAGLVFGVIEAITPILGWSLGTLASDYVEQVDHWIAFALLALVGGHMIRASFSADEKEGEGGATPSRAGALALVATAIGTSIDAAAVGVGLAFIGVNIWVIAASIGLSTFILTTIGMLIGIGCMILVEHLGLLA